MCSQNSKFFESTTLNKYRETANKLWGVNNYEFIPVSRNQTFRSTVKYWKIGTDEKKSNFEGINNLKIVNTPLKNEEVLFTKLTKNLKKTVKQILRESTFFK